MLAVREVANGEAYRVTIDFDDAVDVVTFDSFSAYRRRVTALVSKDGVSPQKTGDRVPHLVVARVGACVRYGN